MRKQDEKSQIFIAWVKETIKKVGWEMDWMT